MELEEIKCFKAKLRFDLSQIITKFEKQTGVMVGCIELLRSKELGKPDQVTVLVKIDLD